VLEMTAQAGGLRRSFSLSGLGEQALADGVLYRASELFQQGLRINFALDEPLGIAVALDSLGRTALASVAETVPRHCSVSAGQGSAHATTAGEPTMSPDPAWAQTCLTALEPLPGVMQPPRSLFPGIR